MSLETVLDEAVAKAIAEKRIVGAVLLVSQNGELLYEKPHGMIDREAGRTMPVDAIFRLASLTKPIVATTILAMKDKGLLRLDDPVTAYFPDFRPALPDGTLPTITIEHLLTHSAGIALAALASPEEMAAGMKPFPWDLGVEAIMGRLGSLPLLYAPGTRWAYSLAIDVLAAIAGKLVDGRAEDAVRAFVLDPLGMKDTSFSVTDSARLAVAYGDGPNGAERMGDIHSVPAPWGGTMTFDTTMIFQTEGFQSGSGGMAGSGPDFMRLLECLRGGGAPIMSAETAHTAFANRLGEGCYSGPGWGFGHLGAVLLDREEASHPAHNGFNRWGGIFGHTWFVDPAIGLSVVSMTNTGLEGSDGAYREEICNAVYSALN